MKKTHIIMLKDFTKDLDLALVILFTLLCIPFEVIPSLNETSIRLILGFLLVLFLPGYSLIAVLFPRKEEFDAIEWFALSFGLSIAISSLVGLALNYTPFGIRLLPILTVLSIFTVSIALGAYIRRSMIPEEERFVVGFDEFKDFLLAQVFFSKKKKCIDRILSVILVISIIIAISMVVYVISMPKEGEKFTEFYVLGPGGKAEDYPTSLKVGEEGEVIIGIVNHEYTNVTYQLEMRLNEEVIGEESIGLMHNETRERPFTFKTMKTGEDQKLEFLLYKNPLNKSVYKPFEKSFINNASQKTLREEPYRALHLWMDVKADV